MNFAPHSQNPLTPVDGPSIVSDASAKPSNWWSKKWLPVALFALMFGGAGSYFLISSYADTHLTLLQSGSMAYGYSSNKSAKLPINNGQALVATAKLSPNGQKIAYVTPAQPRQIVVVNASNGNKIGSSQLPGAGTTNAFGLMELKWSADSTKLALPMRSTTSDWNVWVMDGNGTAGHSVITNHSAASLGWEGTNGIDYFSGTKRCIVDLSRNVESCNPIMPTPTAGAGKSCLALNLSSPATAQAQDLLAMIGWSDCASKANGIYAANLGNLTGFHKVWSAPDGRRVTSIAWSVDRTKLAAVVQAKSGYDLYIGNVLANKQLTFKRYGTAAGPGIAWGLGNRALDLRKDTKPPVVIPMPPAPAQPPAAPSLSSSTSAFSHPGVLLGKNQLDFMKAQVAAGRQPWAQIYQDMQHHGTASTNNQQFGSLLYSPHPLAVIGCGGYDSVNTKYNHDAKACTYDRDDMTAAYTQALLYYITPDNNPNKDKFAQKAIQILNGWSSKLQAVYMDTGANSNGYLHAAWGAETFTRAAEIMRYTYKAPNGESDLNGATFAHMLKLYYPIINHAWSGGGANWLMSAADGSMNIGVYLNDQTIFNQAVANWRAWLPSVIYLQTDVSGTSNKNMPVMPKGTIYDKATTSTATVLGYWHSPKLYNSKFANGLENETCRDSGHMTMGLEATVNAAETARLQGVNLYTENQNRIVTGYERSAANILAGLAGQTGNCNSRVYVTGAWPNGFEIAYNEYANRLHVPMPTTLQLLNQKIRPMNAGYKTQMFMSWEALTGPGSP